MGCGSGEGVWHCCSLVVKGSGPRVIVVGKGVCYRLGLDSAMSGKVMLDGGMTDSAICKSAMRV